MILLGSDHGCQRLRETDAIQSLSTFFVCSDAFEDWQVVTAIAPKRNSIVMSGDEWG